MAIVSTPDESISIVDHKAASNEELNGWVGKNAPISWDSSIDVDVTFTDDRLIFTVVVKSVIKS